MLRIVDGAKLGLCISMKLKQKIKTKGKKIVVHNIMKIFKRTAFQ